MKKPALISLSRSGLNLYLPEELRQHLVGHRYLVEMTTLGDGSRALRYYASDLGRNRIAGHSSPLHPIRLTIRDERIPAELSALGIFGATSAEWTRGDESGELYIQVPPQSAMAEPRIMAPRGQGREAQKRAARLAVAALATVTAATAPVSATPHQRLGEILRELNALIAEGRLPDVVWTAHIGEEESILTGLSRITARREEIFG